MSKSDRFKRLVESRDADTINPEKSSVIEKIVGDFDQQSVQESIQTDKEQASGLVVSNSEHENTSVPVNSNAVDEKTNVSVLRNTDTEQSNVTQRNKSSGGTKIPRAIEEFEKRLKRPTIEETHTRGTWLIRNDLLKRLDKLAKHQQRGFKTHLVNYALERVLDELESK